MRVSLPAPQHRVHSACCFRHASHQGTHAFCMSLQRHQEAVQHQSRRVSGMPTLQHDEVSVQCLVPRMSFMWPTKTT